MEKSIIKSLLYGFLGGVYYYFIFKPRVKVQKVGGEYTYSHMSYGEYFIELIRFSLIISLIAGLIVLIYLFLARGGSRK